MMYIQKSDRLLIHRARGWPSLAKSLPRPHHTPARATAPLIAWRGGSGAVSAGKITAVPGSCTSVYHQQTIAHNHPESPESRLLSLHPFNMADVPPPLQGPTSKEKK